MNTFLKFILNFKLEKYPQKGVVFGLLLLVFTACEDIVDLSVPRGETRLVVDGTVFHGQPLQRVILSTTSPFFEDGQTPRVTGAIVVIENDLGTKDTLLEVETGLYLIEKQGEIERSYKLEITLPDGKKYGSTYQTLVTVPSIDSIYYEEEDTPFASDDEGNLSVKFNFTDPKEVDNYYRWNYYINGEYFNDELTFTDDQFFEGVEVPEVDILREFVELGDTVLIEQLSITEEHYNFLNKFNQNLESGGLFASPPIPVRGNIVNLDDPKEYVLGFFGVSAIERAEIILK